MSNIIAAQVTYQGNQLIGKSLDKLDGGEPHIANLLKTHFQFVRDGKEPRPVSVTLHMEELPRHAIRMIVSEGDIESQPDRPILYERLLELKHLLPGEWQYYIEEKEKGLGATVGCLPTQDSWAEETNLHAALAAKFQKALARRGLKPIHEHNDPSKLAYTLIERFVLFHAMRRDPNLVLSFLG